MKHVLSYRERKVRTRAVKVVEFFRGDRIPPASCCDCSYWSKFPGTTDRQLVCAVNIPRPERKWESKHGLAYSFHHCPDFDPIARE